MPSILWLPVLCAWFGLWRRFGVASGWPHFCRFLKGRAPLSERTAAPQPGTSVRGGAPHHGPAGGDQPLRGRLGTWSRYRGVRVKVLFTLHSSDGRPPNVDCVKRPCPTTRLDDAQNSKKQKKRGKKKEHRKPWPGGKKRTTGQGPLKGRKRRKQGQGNRDGHPPVFERTKCVLDFAKSKQTAKGRAPLDRDKAALRGKTPPGFASRPLPRGRVAEPQGKGNGSHRGAGASHSLRRHPL